MHKVLILGAGKIGALISGLLAEVRFLRGPPRRRQRRGREPSSTRTSAESACPSRSMPPTRRRSTRSSSSIRSTPSSRACRTTATSQSRRRARRAGIHYFDLTEDVEVTRAVRRIAAGRRRRRSCRSAGSRPASSDRGQRAHRALRRAAHRQAARRRPAPAPEQRAEVLAHLVDRGPDQRVRQPVRSDRRRARASKSRRSKGSRRSRSTARCTKRSTPPAASARSAKRTATACRAWTTRRSAIPGHCEQMRLLMNDLKLNHDRATLKRILENAVPQTLQDVVDHLRRRHRPAGRRTARGELRQQGLPAGDRGPPVVRDPGHDGGGHLRRASTS